jgi:hypothetical protein
MQKRKPRQHVKGVVDRAGVRTAAVHLEKLAQMTTSMTITTNPPKLRRVVHRLVTLVLHLRHQSHSHSPQPRPVVVRQPRRSVAEAGVASLAMEGANSGHLLTPMQRLLNGAKVAKETVGPSGAT